MQRNGSCRITNGIRTTVRGCRINTFQHAKNVSRHNKRAQTLNVTLLRAHDAACCWLLVANCIASSLRWRGSSCSIEITLNYEKWKSAESKCTSSSWKTMCHTFTHCANDWLVNDEVAACYWRTSSSIVSERIKGVLLTAAAAAAAPPLTYQIYTHFLRERERKKVACIFCVCVSLQITAVWILLCCIFQISNTSALTEIFPSFVRRKHFQ